MYSVAYLTFLKKGTRKFANYNQEIDKYPADAVLQERLFEFMLEGKRWYDLRRFGDSYVLDYTPAESARLLWPINQGALTNNPLLKQTVGY